MSELRKPSWLKIKLPGGEGYAQVNSIVKKHHLHTICSSGMCPNIAECWGNGVATFMILGDICTRSCKFCATATGRPLPPDANEPENISHSVQLMGLKYCVITSVDRDDLPDKGAQHWYNTVTAIKINNPETIVEVLIPDFDGETELLDIFLKSNPDVVGHNLETIERLTPDVRTKASYRKSLSVLEYVSKKGFKAKSGIMLGLGETKEEVIQTLDDLLSVGCKMITIGQYLQPRPENIPVQRYVTPEEFEEYRKIALEKGFVFAESGPLVRSSYHADKAQELFKKHCKNC
ncbi:MAG TPA: lipoyl synthase [Tenuifilaceae bacterium]|nr:lipoyl synthase [Tenuifilaceae bacterium]HRX32189.1 lipoyl synthase [Tenuifilaceae bacterium]